MPDSLALSAPVLMQQGWLDSREADFLSAEIRVGWTPSRLIVLAKIPDRDIFTQATGPNQKMWELGDVFEMFLKPEDRTDYVELHVTPPNFRLQYQIEAPGKPATELSDGTLRYVLLATALFSPRLPSLLMLNEPENSLHPDLLLPLARLILAAAARTQVWVVAHAPPLIEALSGHDDVRVLALDRELGATRLPGQTALDRAAWRWPVGGGHP